MIETPPLIPVGLTEEVVARVHVMPDQRVEFVPNVGIVVGDRSVLVIDTAMGPRNGQRILAEARRIGEGRRLLLTTTHFHPEHAFAAQSFADATYVCNAAQAEEMAAKGPEYIEMFSGFAPGWPSCWPTSSSSPRTSRTRALGRSSTWVAWSCS